MGLMNKTEYSQACLFRIREALQTAEAWWNHQPELTAEKIEQTVDMLEDVIDELRYFREKMETPTRDDQEHENALAHHGRDVDDPEEEYSTGYDPDFSHGGFFIE